MTQRKFLNLGCGHVILPCERPFHHGLVDEAIYNYPLWHNVDRNGGEGVDECVDVFTYPWRWEDNSFDGALLSHLAEHIPHEIKLNYHRSIVASYNDGEHIIYGDTSPEIERLDQRAKQLSQCQDGWFAFFAELYRVLTPGAIVHILSPYGWSQGAITDPTHARLLTEHTWTHSMQPDPNATFSYETGGIHFEVVNVTFGLYQNWQHLLTHPHDNAETVSAKQAKFNELLRSQINVVNDMYAKLRVVK
jgi:hypothetical protein